MELDTLAKGLVCEDCGNAIYCHSKTPGWLVEWGFYALSASKAIFRARTYNCNLFSPEEKRYGLASKLYVKCTCGVLNEVFTCKSHRDDRKQKRGVPIYDVNTKAAAGFGLLGFNASATARVISRR